MKLSVKKKYRWKRKLKRYRHMFQVYALYILFLLLALVFLPIIMGLTFQIAFVVLALLYLAFTRRTILDKFSWFIMILILPFFGAFIFALIGTTQLKSRVFSRKMMADKRYRLQYKDQITNEMIGHNLLGHFSTGAALFSEGNQIKCMVGMDVYNALLEDIKRAKSSIHIEMYITRLDEVTLPLFDILKKKARSGVDVRFLGDIVGHLFLRDSEIEALIDSGVEFTFFNQRKGRYLDHFHVNHRKAIIIDGSIGYCGGYNLGREYIYGYEKKKLQWFDAMFRIEGSGVSGLQMTFLLDWCFSTSYILLDSKKMALAFFPKVPIKVENGITQMLVEGPDCEKTALKELLRKLIVRAKKRIYITTPYLIPTEDIMADLKLAAHLGIDVRIIIPGVPDKKMVYRCSESYIESFLEAGVKIYKMDGYFVHSKLYLFDDDISVFGTMNLDMRSLFLNFEQAIVQYQDKQLNIEISALFESLFDRSTQLVYNNWKNRPWHQKFQEILLRIFAPLF
ncbi:cardiolipin synthase 1 [Erysipelotrichaceae bacterium]|nr:cardiolipin synthase 1 [Erysipelotrichaceae bacterium]